MRCFRIYSLIVSILLCSTYLTEARAENNITFGVEPEKVLLTNKDGCSNYEEHLTLPLENGYALLYENTKAPILYLSIFSDGKETILWQGNDLGATSLLVPGLILATMKINSNDSLDLIFIYSTNMGIGKYSERWKREAVIFFDGNSISKRLELSSKYVSVDDSEEIFRYYDESGLKPAYSIEAELFLQSFETGVDKSLYVWSKKIEFGGPENIETRVREKIIVYSADDKRSGAQRMITNQKAVDSLRAKLNDGRWIKLK